MIGVEESVKYSLNLRLLNCSFMLILVRMCLGRDEKCTKKIKVRQSNVFWYVVRDEGRETGQIYANKMMTGS